MAQSDNVLAPFLRQWKTIAITFVAVLALAMLYLLLAAPVYRSQAQVQVRPEGAAALPTANSLINDRFLQNQCMNITSSSVILLALNSTEIGDCPTLAPLSEPNRIAYLAKNVTAKPEKGTDFITVSASGARAKDATDIANAIVDTYIRTQGSAREEFEKKIGQQQEVQKSSDEKINQKLAEVQAMQRSIEIERQPGNMTPQEADRLAKQIPALHEKAVEANKLYDDASKMMTDEATSQKYLDQAIKAGAGLMVTEQELADYRQQMNTSSQAVADALRSYLPNHPTVGLLQEKYNRDVARFIVASKSYATLATMKHDAARKSLDEYQRISKEIAEQTGKFNHLTQDLNELKQKRGALESELNKQRNDFDATVTTVVTKHAAVIPTEPASPRKKHTLFFAGLLGLVLGASLAKTRDNALSGLRSAAEIKEHLGLNVLGVVPAMANIRSDADRATQAIETESPTAEAFRGIRAAIYRGLAPDRCKTLLVASSERNEGKSLVVANLAISLVERNLKTLVIDLDLHDPAQHKIFGVRNDLGVCGALAGNERIEDTIQPTNIRDLDIMPADHSDMNPAELINQPAYVEMLDHLAQHYDRIIIDSPAVLSAADARIASAGTDLTIMVVRCDKSHRKLTDLAKEGLLNVGANMLGVIVNDVPNEQLNDFGGLGYLPYGENPSDKKTSSDEKNDSTTKAHGYIIPPSV